jgi:tripartite-type tricarboxylate transporter receptor subunit TctC
MLNKTLAGRAAIICSIAFLTLGLFALPGYAQKSFPSRPITIISPYGAGGANDTLGRMFGVLMEKDLGQPVNVVNRVGGSGAVGHTAGATAAPDGYTITNITGEITMLHWLGMAKVTYKDVRGLVLYCFIPGAVNVRADAPWNTLKDIQDYIKANPGKLKASGTSKGGTWDLCRAGWLKNAGIPIDALPWVPSNGAAPALQELAAGGVQVVTCSLAEARAMIEAKKVKSLAVMDDKRAEIFPDVPTLKELSVNWTSGAWLGLAVPKATPDDIVSILEKSVERAMTSQEFKDFMKKNGFQTWFKPSREFDRYMAEDDEIKGRILKEVGIVK